jgi:hypothetical protein
VGTNKPELVSLPFKGDQSLISPACIGTLYTGRKVTGVDTGTGKHLHGQMDRSCLAIALQKYLPIDGQLFNGTWHPGI